MPCIIRRTRDESGELWSGYELLYKETISQKIPAAVAFFDLCDTGRQLFLCMHHVFNRDAHATAGHRGLYDQRGSDTFAETFNRSFCRSDHSPVGVWHLEVIECLLHRDLGSSNVVEMDI